MLWFVRFACKALFPATDGLEGLEDAHLDRFLRRFLKESNSLMILGLWASSFVFIWSPLLTIFVPLPAFLLPRTLLDKHAYKMAAHPVYPLRSLGMTLKMTAGMAWAAQPGVRKALGRPPLPDDPATFKEGDA